MDSEGSFFSQKGSLRKVRAFFENEGGRKNGEWLVPSDQWEEFARVLVFSSKR